MHSLTAFHHRNFNPLPRKEGDAIQGIMTALSQVISIHSLVKRETICMPSFGYSFQYFNPLPRKEGDLDKSKIITLVKDFNPLPRKEGD